MITHEINPHKSYYQNNTYNNYTQNYHQARQQRSNIYGKQEYASFIGRLIFSRGDYVVPQRTPYPYQKHDYLRVADIQEIHYMATCNEYGIPRCVYAINQNRNGVWYTPSELIKVSTSPIIIPILGDKEE